MCSYLSDELSTFSDRQTLQLLFTTLHASFCLSCECLALKSHGIPDDDEIELKIKRDLPGS